MESESERPYNFLLSRHVEFPYSPRGQFIFDMCSDKLYYYFSFHFRVLRQRARNKKQSLFDRVCDGRISITSIFTAHVRSTNTSSYLVHTHDKDYTRRRRRPRRSRHAYCMACMKLFSQASVMCRTRC